MSSTGPGRFDFADVMLSHEALRSLPDAPATRVRLWDRVERGPAPPCPAALLAEWGDRRGAALLRGLAAYLDPPDMPALVVLGATDALAAAVAAPWVPAPIRAAAADALARTEPTPEALCALAEVAEQGKTAPRPNVLSAHDALALRADEDLRAAADKLRSRVKLVRTWTGVRRQELQREVATGVLHPVVGLLAGDATFLATLVPPFADPAREALLPALLTNARVADESVRRNTFAFFHGRWRDVARDALSGLARFVRLRGRDEALPVLAVGALAAMGATLELVYAAVAGSPEARGAALAALERAGARAIGEAERAALVDAAAYLAQGGDEAAAARLQRLLPDAPP